MQARDLILSFMTKDLTRRFGCMRDGVRDIQRHPWFIDVDWPAVEAGRCEMAWVPTLQSATVSSWLCAASGVGSRADLQDVRNFVVAGQDFTISSEHDVDVDVGGTHTRLFLRHATDTHTRAFVQTPLTVFDAPARAGVQ